MSRPWTEEFDFCHVHSSSQPPAPLDLSKEEMIARIVKLETSLMRMKSERVEREKAKERRMRELYEKDKKEALRMKLPGGVLSLCACKLCEKAFFERGYVPEQKLWCSMCHRGTKCCICRSDGEPVIPFPPFEEWLVERKKMKK
jgi:hypothetical protein